MLLIYLDGRLWLGSDRLGHGTTLLACVAASVVPALFVASPVRAVVVSVFAFASPALLVVSRVEAFEVQVASAAALAGVALVGAFDTH